MFLLIFGISAKEDEMTTKGNMVWGQQKGAGEQEWVLREDD
jgi:hypothetical protein